MEKVERKVVLVIDNDTLEKYTQYYFTLHPKARKKPIPNPYHESINKWMIMRRPQMNALKQKWKDFMIWLVVENGYDDMYVDKCAATFKTFYNSSRRHDIDNSVPKFILDGLCESNFINDDDSNHILKLTLECYVDKNNPRTEIYIDVFGYDRNFKKKELKEKE